MIGIALASFVAVLGRGVHDSMNNAIDGQLYVAGLRGWQTDAAKDCALQRVRFTGKPVNMPTSFHVKENGIELGFTTALDPASAGDADSYDVEQWNYMADPLADRKTVKG